MFNLFHLAKYSASSEGATILKVVAIIVMQAYARLHYLNNLMNDTLRFIVCKDLLLIDKT